MRSVLLVRSVLLSLLLSGCAHAAPPSAKGESAKAEPTERCAPGAATELLEQGRRAQRAGKADEALERYSDALTKDPTCAAALWEAGWSHQSKGDLDAAVTAWDKLRKLSPDYPQLDTHYSALVSRHEQAAQLKALPEPGPLPPPEQKPDAEATITIAAVGDVNMGMAWPTERAALPPNNAMDLFSGVKPILQDADITFGNLETVLADSGDSVKCRKGSTKCFAFRVPTSFAQALKDAGFDVMSVANNHTGDFGPEGRLATKAALDAVGILHSGPIGDIASWEVKGVKVALVAFSFGADVYRIQELDIGRKVVANLAKEHDLVLVSFHAGAEGKGADHVPVGTEMFLGEDRGDSRAFAHAMIDAGADLLIGHGPHLLRAMEVYNGRLIAYSLGNFSSYEVFGLGYPNNITGILKVRLARNGVALSAELQPAVMVKPGRPVPDPEKRAIVNVRRLSREDFGSPVLDEEGKWTRPAEASNGKGER
jgi:hypothetical protein